MLRTLTCLFLVVACSPTPINRECDPNDCPTRQCRDGRCDQIVDAGTIRIDTGFDASTRDAGPVQPDTGASACAAVCTADEACFRGRCVRCTGDNQVEGCACVAGGTCRTGSCIGGLCEMCILSTDCSAEEGSTAFCDEGMCTTCGGTGEACCIDPMTSMPGLCDEAAGACTVAGLCGACGALGQTCCAGEEACTAPATCGPTSACESCGVAGAPPCADGTCAARHIAVAGVCTPCGANGQMCCPAGIFPRCTPGLCNGTTCQRDGP